MIRPYIADIITLSRLIGSTTLMTYESFSLPFMIIYTYCGLTDAIDGFVARKLNIVSTLGKKLDSVSDLVFYAVMLYKVWPTLLTILPAYVITIVWTIFGIRAACYLFVFIRDKKLASEHFILNKATGLLMFFIPYFIKLDWFIYYALLICFVAIIAALNEFCFHLIKK